MVVFPTHVHGLTLTMLDGQPQFADIAGGVVDACDISQSHTMSHSTMRFSLRRPRSPVSSRLTSSCTVELARRLQLSVDNLRLEHLPRIGVCPSSSRDAFDDVRVLTGIWQLLRNCGASTSGCQCTVTRRQWPNGRVTHDELRPLKALAARMAATSTRAGMSRAARWSRACGWGWRPVKRTHEELVERILHAGLAYSVVDQDTSLVVCSTDRPRTQQGPFTPCSWGFR